MRLLRCNSGERTCFGVWEHLLNITTSSRPALNQSHRASSTTPGDNATFSTVLVTADLAVMSREYAQSVVEFSLS